MSRGTGGAIGKYHSWNQYLFPYDKNDNRPTNAYRCSSNKRRLGGVSLGRVHENMLHVVCCFGQQREIQQLSQLSVWGLFSPQQLCQHHPRSHSLCLMAWFIKATHFPLLQNVQLVNVVFPFRSTHWEANLTCICAESPLNALMDISGSTWWKHWDGLFFCCHV